MGEGADWWVEQRYRAVLEVRAGSPVAEVADRYGVSRQAVYGWRTRFAEAGVAGLAIGRGARTTVRRGPRRR